MMTPAPGILEAQWFHLVCGEPSAGCRSWAHVGGRAMGDPNLLPCWSVEKRGTTRPGDSRNERGEYAAAKKVCESALVHITDADREYVTLFLPIDIQMAVAEAGLGQVDAGLGRIDACLERFRDCDHPLVQGFLHEARARIAWMAGLTDEYNLSVTIVDHWFRRTGTPALIAKCERLADLRTGPGGAHALQAGTFVSTKSNAVTGIESGRLEPEARTVQASVRRSPETA